MDQGYPLLFSFCLFNAAMLETKMHFNPCAQDIARLVLSFFSPFNLVRVEQRRSIMVTELLLRYQLTVVTGRGRT